MSETGHEYRPDAGWTPDARDSGALRDHLLRDHDETVGTLQEWGAEWVGRHPEAAADALPILHDLQHSTADYDPEHEHVDGTAEVDVHLSATGPAHRVEVPYTDVPYYPDEDEIDPGDILGGQVEAWLDDQFGVGVPRRWNLA